MGIDLRRQRNRDIPVLPRVPSLNDQAGVRIGADNRLYDRQETSLGSDSVLVGLTRSLALETGPYGVRVNMISPGPVEGERIEWVIRKQAEGRGISVEEARQELAKGSPLERLVPPEDVAAVAVFLASSQASSITGEDMNVSGGLVMY